MARQVKCQHCTNKDSKELMRKESKGYYHQSCYEESESQKQTEFTDWCELYETIKAIHNKKVIDGRFVMTLRDIRNGTIRQGAMVQKRSKEGIPYKDITLAYEQSRDIILQTIATKPFDTEIGEIRYCFGIVKNKINEIALDRNRTESMQEEKVKILHESKTIQEIIQKASEVSEESTPEENRNEILSLWD